MLKKGIIKLVLVLFLGLFILSMSTVVMAQGAEKKGIIIGGCSPVGTWTLVAGMFSNLINKYYPGYRASPLGTAGCSIENIWRIDSREMEVAITTSADAFAGCNALEPFKKKMNIAGAIAIYSSANHLMALKSSGIKTTGDLKGKKINISNPGTFSENFNRKVLFPALDLDVNKDIRKDNSNLSEAINKMRDGHVDAMSFSGGIGSSYYLDLASSRDIIFVPLAEGVVDKILKENPFLIRVVIPAGAYKGQAEPILTVGPVNEIIVAASLSEDFVYNITKIFFEHIDEARKVHPLMNDISLQYSFQRVTTPLHPGAAKYYAEHGLRK